MLQACQLPRTTEGHRPCRLVASTVARRVIRKAAVASLGSAMVGLKAAFGQARAAKARRTRMVRRATRTKLRSSMVGATAATSMVTRRLTVGQLDLTLRAAAKVDKEVARSRHRSWMAQPVRRHRKLGLRSLELAVSRSPCQDEWRRTMRSSAMCVATSCTSKALGFVAAASTTAAHRCWRPTTRRRLLGCIRLLAARSGRWRSGARHKLQQPTPGHEMEMRSMCFGTRALTSTWLPGT